MTMNALYVPDRIAEGIVATILAGQTTSDVVNLGGCFLIAIDMPASFDGTSLKIKTGETPDSLLDTYDTLGNQLVIVAGSNRRIILSAYDFRAAKYIQLVADEQSADRAITLIPGELP